MRLTEAEARGLRVTTLRHVLPHMGPALRLLFLERGRYGVEFTGTLPPWRGQGLATLAKLSALHLAATADVRWVGTANDEDNAPMLRVNRSLGHQPLADLMIYEREI